MSYYPRGVILPVEMQRIRERTQMALLGPRARADAEALISSHEHLRALWLVVSNRARLQEQEIEGLRIELRRLEAEKVAAIERGRNLR